MYVLHVQCNTNDGSFRFYRSTYVSRIKGERGMGGMWALVFWPTTFTKLELGCYRSGPARPSCKPWRKKRCFVPRRWVRTGKNCPKESKNVG